MGLVLGVKLCPHTHLLTFVSTFPFFLSLIYLDRDRQRDITHREKHEDNDLFSVLPKIY